MKGKITDRQSLYIIMENEKEMRKDILIRKISEKSIRQNGEHPSITNVDCSTLGQKNHWLKDSWFNDDFIFFKRGDKYWIKWKKFATDDEIKLSDVKVDYNSPEKQKIREFTFDGIENIENPIIQTFAAENGLCVDYILKKNPSSKIINVEYDKNVLNKFLNKKFPTINFLGDYNKFLKTITSSNLDYPKHYNYIFYDSMGYLANKMANNLKIINDCYLTDNLILTIQTGSIRNTGYYANESRRITRGLEDPTIYIINQILSNYNLVDFMCYPASSKKFNFTVFKYNISFGMKSTYEQIIERMAS